MSRPRGDADETSGFALLAVLSFLLLIASVSTGFFTSARDFSFVSRNLTQGLRAEMVTRSVLALAAQRYLERSKADESAPDAISCRLSGRYDRLDVTFRNHAGLIDLNAASNELLRLGFSAIGASAADARLLAATVIAYRSIDPTGDSGDVELEVVGGPKHGLFDSVSELRDFRLTAGVDTAALRDVFTVESRSGTIDERYFSPRLKSAVDAVARESLPFVVSGRRRLPALTVVAALSTREGVTTRSSAIYQPEGGESQTARRVGPISTVRATAPAEVAGRVVACDHFLDPGSLSLVAELTK